MMIMAKKKNSVKTPLSIFLKDSFPGKKKPRKKLSGAVRKSFQRVT